ncbi:helix-turn-helix domain-containing protein [Bdellovibrio sp. HCB209]|uniref:helix-turn-helix domain-containing protein n=1 Tax=Bdellovibrio sp. HCB209 TaxID=3394354 RepID=UPI0039B4F883
MDIQIQKIKAVLKDQLKKRKMTYEDLAEEMEVSVPTIKRWMGDHDLGLNDLFRICDILDLNLSDLHALTATVSSSKSPNRLTDEQQKFLVKNMNYLAFFLQIHEGKTPQEIAERYKLTKLSVDKYLLRLEKLEMIKVTGKLRVKSAFDAQVNFGDGVLAKTYYKRWIDGTGEFFTSVISDAITNEASIDAKTRDHKSHATYSIQTVKLTKESYQKWATENAAAIMQLSAIGKIEEKAYKEDELFTAVILNAHVSLRQDSKYLKIVDEFAGKIDNI